MSSASASSRAYASAARRAAAHRASRSAKATAAEGGSTSSPAWSAAKNRESRLRFLSAYQCGSMDAIAFSREPLFPPSIEAPSFP